MKLQKNLIDVEVARRSTKVIKCTCTDSYQNGRYGYRMRLHNRMDVDPVRWRCTICKAENT